METVIKNKLQEEIDKIKDAEIHNIVTIAIECVPEYFWHTPSATHRGHHPEDEMNENGLAIHTLRDVKTVWELAPAYQREFTQRDFDLAAAALVLHDCCKCGKTEHLGTTKHEHPIWAAEWLCDLFPDSETATEIAGLIKTHMGPWTTSKYSDEELEYPENGTLNWLVFLCDYIASRVNIEVKW